MHWKRINIFGPSKLLARDSIVRSRTGRQGPNLGLGQESPYGPLLPRQPNQGRKRP